MKESDRQTDTYMLQAFLLELLYGGVFGHFLQPLRALHGADVDLQYFPSEYLLLLYEHDSLKETPQPKTCINVPECASDAASVFRPPPTTKTHCNSHSKLQLFNLIPSLSLSYPTSSCSQQPELYMYFSLVWILFEEIRDFPLFSQPVFVDTCDAGDDWTRKRGVPLVRMRGISPRSDWDRLFWLSHLYYDIMDLFI